MIRVADAHADTLYEIAIKHTPPENCHVMKETMTAGNVCLQTFALFAGRRGTRGTAHQDGLDMLKASYALPVPVFRGALPDAFPEVPSGIISCEGGEMFEGSLERFREFNDETRLRMIALTWNFENEIGFPGKGGSDQPLKPFGRTLLEEMGRSGVLADVSHLNDAGFWDVCERSVLPPIASHSNCRWLCGHSRNLTKEMVLAIIERRGFIGMNFYAPFVSENPAATIDELLRHIDAVCELGGEDVLGFGSDFDGIDAWPEYLEGPAAFPRLLEALAARGYSADTLEKLAWKNLWRVLKTADRAAFPR
ncbi:MAG: membrane dipeptidase [Clostridia bacterium]|nr:membrane dipeptidase [Clostridia bacterium]